MADYYEILKVKRNASQDEIKISFRKLAHVYHPDKPTGNVSAFLLIKQAYDTLSDPEKRKNYDLNLDGKDSSSGGMMGKSSRPAYDPTLCNTCGVRAPLKHARLFQNVGLLFRRYSSSIEGNLCKNCIDKYFTRFSLITVFFGWWGVISFFVTIAYLLNNVFVFLKSVPLKRVRSSPKTFVLAWATFLIVLLVPTYVFILGASSSDSTAPQSAVTAEAVIPQAQPPAVASPTILTNRRSYNGEVIKKDRHFFGGRGELTIVNGTQNDAVAKLVTSEDKSLVYEVYLTAGSEVVIQKITDGNYRLLFGTGIDWDGNGFTRSAHYEAFDEVFDFLTTTYQDEEYKHTRYATFRVTLNPVAGGDATTSELNETDFMSF